MLQLSEKMLNNLLRKSVRIVVIQIFCCTRCHHLIRFCFSFTDLFAIDNIEKSQPKTFLSDAKVTISSVPKPKPIALIKKKPDESSNTTVDIIDDFSSEYQEVDEVDDIDLVDGSGVTIKSDGTEVHKYSIVAVGSSKKQEIVLNDCSNSSFHYDINSENSLTEYDDQRELYACRHCGKRYRWKSTLRKYFFLFFQ